MGVDMCKKKLKKDHKGGIMHMLYRTPARAGFFAFFCGEEGFF